jgi:general secretion pathway protein J
MVAAMLVAVMTLMLLGALRLSVRAQDESSALQRRYHAGWVTLNRIARELSMAFISTHVNQEEGRSKTLFDGSKNKILFTTLAHERRTRSSQESDQSVVEYYVKSTRGGGKGLFRRQKLILDDSPESGGQVDLVAEDIHSVEFEYWDREDQDWSSDWEVSSDDFEAGPGGQQVDEMITEEDKTLQLPWRVRVTLTLLGPSGKKLEFQTQTAIHMREALDFTNVLNSGGSRNRVGQGGIGQGLGAVGGLPGIPAGGLQQPPQVPR